MYIGVKYCGGCNPSYDRKAEVERLAAKLDMDKLEPVQDGIKYEKNIYGNSSAHLLR